MAGSSAIGAGDPALAGTSDQRGIVRGTPVTIGAYQAASATAPATALSASVGSSVYGQLVTFTATVTSGGSAVTAGTVTFREGATTLGMVTVNGSGQAAYSTAALSVAGSPHTITATYNPSGAYLTSTGTASLTVSRAALTVRADDKSKVYGQANPALTARYSGFVLGEGPGVLGGSLTLTTAATASSGVRNYSITPAGLTAANYTITFVNGTLTVTPATLTITADSKSKVYGSANPLLTASYSGFVNGDTPASLTAPVVLTTPATAASGVGTYPITPSGAASPNYTISYTAGTLTVTRAALLVTADNKSKVYSSANPTLTATYSGFVNGDTAASLGGSLTLNTTATGGSGVGTYPITAGGAASPNYTISYVSGTLTVAPAPLTVRADDKARARGQANPPLTATFSGFVNGDTPASPGGTLALSTAATPLSPAGTYPITAGGLTSSNYVITFVSGTLTVTPAALTFVVTNGATMATAPCDGRCAMPRTAIPSPSTPG